jgi:hypothetical protein
VVLRTQCSEHRSVAQGGRELSTEAQLKSKFWAIGIACFLIFCVAPASALAASISGTVTEASTGLPRDEVTACAEAVHGSGYCVGVPEDGEYSITGLEPDEYRVSFQPAFNSGYVRQYYQGTIYYSDATLITLGAGDEVTGINAAIEEGATVSGTVTAADGSGPIEGIQACAREVGGEGYQFCAQTESDGTYEILGVPADPYSMTFESGSSGAAYATRYYDEKSFEVEADHFTLASGQQFTADAAMSRAGAIEGTATKAGKPLQYDFVCAYTLAEVKVGCTVTEEEGKYRYEGLPVGSYILELESFGQALQFSGGAATFATATPVTVAAESSTIENFEIPGPPGISGTIRDAGTGEAPAGRVFACLSSEHGTNCTQIESDGTYEIPIEAGEYLVYFEGEGYVRQYYDGVSSEAAATHVTVGGSMVNGIDAELDPAGSIAGHVTAASGGTNLGSTEVCALAGSTVVECGITGSDGNYAIPSLTPGNYKVRFSRTSYATQYYNGKATAAEAETVTVRARETTGVINAAMVKLVRPSNTSPPVLSGTGKVGETLGCTQGVWANNPTSYEFYWYRTGQEIRGAEANTYKLVTADAGKKIKCGVLAKNGAGNSSVVQSTATITVASIRTLTVTKAGSGTVTSVPVGIECGSTCTVSRNEGEALTLTATPAAHFQLTGWSGACSGVGTCEVTFGSTNPSVTATFAQITHPVAVAVTGAGSVTAGSGGISGCTESGGTCSGAYPETSEVTLTASPDAHHEFTGWTGCTTQSGTECKVAVEAAENVTAAFAPIPRALSVSKSGNGAGTVTSSPAGINCGTTCAGTFVDGEAITLTATPAAHSEFIGWSGGGCTGTQTCTVTLGSDTAVAAEFSKITHGISVAVTGAGSVSADNGAISGCTEAGGACAGTYDEGTEVTLTASPDAHHRFTGWTGCTVESGDGCEVTVEGAENVTATFAPIVHQLTVTKSGDGTGTVTSGPAGIACGVTCAAGFEDGTAITLTAVADPGSEFTGWSGACTGVGPCAITLGIDSAVVANFAKTKSDGGGGDTGGGSSGGSNSGGSGNSNPPAPPAPQPAPKHAKKKPLQCKKGFHKAKQKGKVRCIKLKSKAKGKRG